jgi:hypothetical protein
MSIKGIDAQMMIARTTEYVKDSAVQLKKSELTQDYLTAQALKDEAIEKTKVAKPQGAEKLGLALEADRKHASGGDSGGRKDKKDEGALDGEDGPGQLVPPGNNIIDVRV